MRLTRSEQDLAGVMSLIMLNSLLGPVIMTVTEILTTDPRGVAPRNNPVM